MDNESLQRALKAAKDALKEQHPLAKGLMGDIYLALLENYICLGKDTEAYEFAHQELFHELAPSHQAKVLLHISTLLQNLMHDEIITDARKNDETIPTTEQFAHHALAALLKAKAYYDSYGLDADAAHVNRLLHQLMYTLIHGQGISSEAFLVKDSICY